MAIIQIGNKNYESKAKAKDFYRKILNESKEKKIDSLSTEYAALLDLLELHPRATEKMENGISCFIIKQTAMGSPCFFIRDTNGNEVDFSFIKCIDGNPPPYSLFCKAARNAVEYQIMSKRVGGMHVDHYPIPFCLIAERFIKNNKIVLAETEYTHGIGLWFSDKEIERKFQDFHLEVARYRIISKEENISLAYEAKKMLQEERAT